MSLPRTITSSVPPTRFRPGLNPTTLRWGLAVAALAAAGPLAAQSKKVAEWETACDAGQARECHELARAHLRGRERLARDGNEAARYFGKACELGEAQACQELGEALITGAEGIPLDTAAAMGALAQACDLDPTGRSGRTLGLLGGRNRCQAITELFRRRAPATREDSVTAKRVASRACDRARIEVACVLLDAGWRAFPDSTALPDSVKREIAAAIERARQDSIRRVADSLQRVADSTAAEARARQEADAARARAGAQRTRPDPRDERRRGTLKANCDAGSAGSCSTLADWVRRGRGGPRNPAEAEALSRRACELDPRYCPRR